MAVRKHHVKLRQADKLPLLPATYQHYRTKDTYRAVGLITYTGNRGDEELVHYYSTTSLRQFARPVYEFMGYVVVKGKTIRRFKRVKS